MFVTVPKSYCQQILFPLKHYQDLQVPFEMPPLNFQYDDIDEQLAMVTECRA